MNVIVCINYIHPCSMYMGLSDAMQDSTNQLPWWKVKEFQGNAIKFFNRSYHMGIVVKYLDLYFWIFKSWRKNSHVIFVVSAYRESAVKLFLCYFLYFLRIRVLMLIIKETLTHSVVYNPFLLQSVQTTRLIQNLLIIIIPLKYI